MDFAALRLAAELGGHLLSGPEPTQSLVLVERLRAHALPTLLVFGQGREDLAAPLGAWDASTAELNLACILPTSSTEVARALACHRLRIGSLLGAVDAALPWLEDRPMMAKRLPGRLRSVAQLPLESAFLRPLERADLRTHLPLWPEPRLLETFVHPPWQAEGTRLEVAWWPGTACPAGAEIVRPPLELPSQAPFPETFRRALRLCSAGPVPWLPHPGDPSNLQALALLTPNIAAFRGPVEAWAQAFDHLAELPSPPHFCGRC